MKIKKNPYLLVAIIALLLSFTNCSSTANKIKVKPIQNFDLKRYVGTWYEIARFPHRFERNLVGVTATYNLLANGKIEVINQGFMHSLNGPVKTAIGKAKPAGNDGAGHLRVSFFWIFYTDYLILELDEQNYQYSLVGSSSPNYLWILSRTPQMDSVQLNKLIHKAKDLGYDVSKLEMVDQPM